MAEATYTEKSVVVTAITLKLSAEEAGTLLAILARGVTGPDNGPRGHTNAIHDALKNLGELPDVFQAHQRAIRLAERRKHSWGVNFREEREA